MADAGTGSPVLDGLVQLGEQLPFNRHLGVQVDEVEIGRCRTRLPADQRLSNHLGGVHAIAELAPVELAGALAASGRLAVLLERGYVPVVGGLEVRYRAPAEGDLVATATVGEEVVEPAIAAADAGEKPRVQVQVEVTDLLGTVVTRARLDFVYVPLSPPEESSA